MNVKSRWLFLVALVTFVAGLTLSACGGEDPEASNDGNTNQSTEDNTEEEPAGDDQESSFDVEIEDEAGETSTKTASQPNEEASESSWGAVINSGILQMTLVSDDGITISVIVETTESATSPGTFALSTPPEGTNVTMIDITTGDAFDSGTTGTIQLDNCAAAVGDKVVGSFQGVELNGEMSGQTRTLDGDFDVTVYSVLGSLFCAEEEEEEEEEETDPDPTNQCGYEVCEEDGACCPYLPCMSQCNFECLTQDAECGGGMNPTACAECAISCYTDCGVSDTCFDALNDQDQCSAANGCDDLSEDEEQACLETNCCSELKAAF